MLFSSDYVLARRLEAAEAANARFLAQQIEGAEAEDVGGGCAMFAGAGSPISHVLGLGMSGDPTVETLDRVEQFFFDRGTACVIDLCPLATPMLEEVFRRGYKLIECNNVMIRDLSVRDEWIAGMQGVEATMASEAESGVWALTVAQGFSGLDDPPPDMLNLLGSGPGPAGAWIARADGQVIGGAGMGVQMGVALYYGDATRIQGRNRGAQRALIRARSAYAASHGCDLAAACVIPGSASHRNYEREGFRLVYMRVNVVREP